MGCPNELRPPYPCKPWCGGIVACKLPPLRSVSIVNISPDDAYSLMFVSLCRRTKFTQKRYSLTPSRCPVRTVLCFRVNRPRTFSPLLRLIDSNACHVCTRPTSAPLSCQTTPPDGYSPRRGYAQFLTARVVSFANYLPDY